MYPVFCYCVVAVEESMTSFFFWLGGGGGGNPSALYETLVVHT